MLIGITWHDIALRLLLAGIGGALIGLNREEHGQGAGLRTTMLVCLAASISMVQVNLLLGVVGKASNSFVVLDLMRLPLGILSGMGFIGAGAIVKKGNLVHGVTTAATLWFVTTMGLCFGGGQLYLGLAALVLGWIVLSILRRLEKRINQHRHATLTIMTGEHSPSGAEFSMLLSKLVIR
jgi:putative Mg2+ transporter-C (MgtC) family protein